MTASMLFLMVFFLFFGTFVSANNVEDPSIKARFLDKISEMKEQVTPQVQESLQSLASFIDTHWDKCKENAPCYYAVWGVGGATTVSVALMMIPPLLASIGFSAVGPVAGSLAASFQSTFGATAGFSFLQSVAMGGISTSSWMSLTALGGTLAASFRSIQQQEPQQQPQDESQPQQ